MKAQGIDAKILVDEEKPLTSTFERFQKTVEDAAGQFGAGGQSQTDMGQFYRGGGQLFDQIANLPGNIQDILQFLSEQEKMTPGEPDMFRPTLPPVDEEEEDEEKK